MSLRRTDPPSREEVDRWLDDLKSVTCAELAALRAAGRRPEILDVRTEGERAAARIPGSHFVPLHEFEARTEELLALPGPLYVHCAHGVRSVDACLLLRWQGRDDVINVLEGLSAWTGPTESG